MHEEEGWQVGELPALFLIAGLRTAACAGAGQDPEYPKNEQFCICDHLLGLSWKICTPVDWKCLQGYISGRKRNEYLYSSGRIISEISVSTGTKIV